jgi:hypothetical protein
VTTIAKPPRPLRLNQKAELIPEARFAEWHRIASATAGLSELDRQILDAIRGYYRLLHERGYVPLRVGGKIVVPDQVVPLRPVAHLEPFARVGHHAYGLVALVLDDKLGAGLNYARHCHVYGLSVRTGPHHGLVDVGNEDFISSRGKRSAGALIEYAGVDEHLKPGCEHVGRDVDVDIGPGFGWRGERSENWNR